MDLDHTRITSPVDGVVIARNMDVGQTVQASYSAPQLFSIAQDLSKMHVETNIDESDISRVQVDQEATFTVDAYPGQTFHGTVMQIRHSPTNVQNVITYTVVIAVDNPDMKLFPGMTANVRLVTDHLSAAIEDSFRGAAVPPAGRPAAGRREEHRQEDRHGRRRQVRSQPVLRAATASSIPASSRAGGGGGGGRRRRRRRRRRRWRRPGRRRRPGARAAAARHQFQTVYTLDEKGQLKAERIRTGISDGNFVAMLGGNLKEGQELVTGIEGARRPEPEQECARDSPARNQNQFKGGRGGFGF